MSPGGVASHTVAVDGNPVATWAGAMGDGTQEQWTGSVANAHTVRITTTKSPSWVSWDSITLYGCAH
jgi:hypothetical protein